MTSSFDAPFADGKIIYDYSGIRIVNHSHRKTKWNKHKGNYADLCTFSFIVSFLSLSLSFSISLFFFPFAAPSYFFFHSQAIFPLNSLSHGIRFLFYFLLIYLWYNLFVCTQILLLLFSKIKSLYCWCFVAVSGNALYINVYLSICVVALNGATTTTTKRYITWKRESMSMHKVHRWMVESVWSECMHGHSFSFVVSCVWVLVWVWVCVYVPHAELFDTDDVTIAFCQIQRKVRFECSCVPSHTLLFRLGFSVVHIESQQRFIVHVKCVFLSS